MLIGCAVQSWRISNANNAEVYTPKWLSSRPVDRCSEPGHEPGRTAVTTMSRDGVTLLMLLLPLLVLSATNDNDVIRCYSCASANTADKWGPNSSWRHMYKGKPLEISDACLDPGPSVKSVECNSSCFRVAFVEKMIQGWWN